MLCENPDHLGTNTLLTDMDGNAYQMFLNLPFGETMAEQSGSAYYQSPYKFNGKELDKETGLYYYGARYYDPRTSMWLGVDPMVEKYPGISPYNYCANNPIIFIDPDGNKIELFHEVFHYNADGSVTRKMESGFVSGKSYDAMHDYLKTPEGYNFAAKFAVEGQEICGIKFDKTGEYADQTLRYNQVDENNGENGSTDMFFEWISKNERHEGGLDYGENVEGKVVLEININEFYTSDDKAGTARAALTLGHESFLHNRSLTKIMNHILKNEWAKAQSVYSKGNKDAGIQGSIEHSQYISGFKGFDRFNSFKQSLIKLLGNDAKKAISDHDKNLKNE